MKRLLCILAVFGIFAAPAVAAPITFDVVFTGTSTGARATGFVTLESTLLPNPGSIGSGSVALPNPAVIDLSLTVSGAINGNGTFGLGSFSLFIWSTGGATLDLTRELVGQTTPGGPWGTACNGDFNLLAVGPPTPNGVECFTMAPNGVTNTNGETMVLTSMIRRETRAIPTLSESMLVLLAVLLGAGAARAYRRRA